MLCYNKLWIINCNLCFQMIHNHNQNITRFTIYLRLLIDWDKCPSLYILNIIFDFMEEIESDHFL